MKQDIQKTKKIATKIVENNGSTPLAHLDVAMDTNDKLDALKESIENPKGLKVEITNEPSDIAKAFFSMLKGEKGDEPSDDRLNSLIKPLIPDPIQPREPKDGQDGKDAPVLKKNIDYFDGKDGYTPIKNKDYFDGEDGEDGKDGTNGKDGSPDTAEEIVIKLQSLEGEERLDAKYIKNLPQFTREIIREIGGAHGGAYETPIKAGSNVTVRKDAFGAYVISATGGDGSGGFTYINEIVAGSGTSFTLANVPADSTRVALYGGGSRLIPTADYTISGATITMTNSYSAGQVLADYS